MFSLLHFSVSAFFSLLHLSTTTTTTYHLSDKLLEMASEENYLIVHESLERRKHHEPTSCFLAKHRDTTYKDIPINQLIPLAFHTKVAHLEEFNIHRLISIVCKKYDNSNLFSDWQKYCKALDSEQQAIAVLGMGSLSFYEYHTHFLKKVHFFLQQKLYRHQKIEKGGYHHVSTAFIH